MNENETGEGCLKLAMLLLLNAAKGVAIAVVLLVIAFWGEPDLVDAIIQHLTGP